MYNVVFFKGILETMDYFTDQLCQGAKELGCDVYVANTKDVGSYNSDAFYNFLGRENVFVVLLNHIGLNLQKDGVNLWSKYGVMVFDFVQDHPRNFEDSLMEPVTDIHAIVLDDNHRKYIQRFYPKVKYIHFMPNGGAEVSGWMPYCKRPIDVLYVGNCQRKLTQAPIIPFLEDSGADFYSSVLEFMKNNPTFTSEDAMEKYFYDRGITITEEQLYQLNQEPVMFIEENIRHYFKQKVLWYLSDLGIKTEIYGDNWQGDFDINKNVNIHNRISSEGCNVLSGQAKICINCMPWYKDGCSERVFNTMLNASVCVSDSSRYLKEKFEYGRDIVFYELDNIEQMACDILFLLDNTELAENIAMNGYLEAKLNHSWKKRMEAIIGFYEEDKSLVDE